MNTHLQFVVASGVKVDQVRVFHGRRGLELATHREGSDRLEDRQRMASLARRRYPLYANLVVWELEFSVLRHDNVQFPQANLAVIHLRFQPQTTHQSTRGDTVKCLYKIEGSFGLLRYPNNLRSFSVRALFSQDSESSSSSLLFAFSALLLLFYYYYYYY